jgi:phosphatidylglycerol---prolipoprotein diacylglyceryl transferase
MLPILYQSHDLILYSYPLLMGLGWGVAYQILFAKADIDVKHGQFLFWGIFVSSWLGSKLFFYFTTESMNHPELLSQTSFWTGGGFVFYGGLIFAILFLGLYKLLKLPLSRLTFWALLPAITFGHAIGRIGCFLAGCCYGSETDLWWGVDLHGAHRHPTQVLESLGLFIIAFYILKARPSVRSLAVYLIGYGLLRFGIEILRGDEIRGIWGVFTPSQWISLSMILSGLFVIFMNKIKQLDKNELEQSSL